MNSCDLCAIAVIASISIATGCGTSDSGDATNGGATNDYSGMSLEELNQVPLTAENCKALAWAAAALNGRDLANDPSAQHMYEMSMCSGLN